MAIENDTPSQKGLVAAPAISPRDLFLFFIIPGLAQGLGFYFLFDSNSEGSFAVRQQAAAMFLLVAPLALYFTTSKAQRVSSALFALGLGLLCAGLLWLAIDIFGGPDESGLVSGVSWVSSFFIAYIAVPFFRTVVERQKPPTDYPSLFEFAWNLPVLGAGAAIFSGVVWMVLGLWAALFALIGIDFFQDLFFDQPFWEMATCASGALGIGILRSSENIVLALRGVLFALLKVLAPVVALMTAAFALSAFVQGLDKIWEGWSATGLMLWAIIVAVVLANAVVGDKGKPENPILKYGLMLQAFVLPVLAGFAIYGLYLRINEYGLTVSRIHVAIIVSIAAAYALLYAFSMFLPGRYAIWRMGNILLAGVIFFLAIFIQTPLLNVYSMSAQNQVARLLDGREDIEDFDFAYLKWELGEAGEKALVKLREAKSYPRYGELVAMLDELDAAETSMEYRAAEIEDNLQDDLMKALEDGAISVTGFDDEASFVNSLLQNDDEWNSIGSRLRRCEVTEQCLIIRADLLPRFEEQLLFVRIYSDGDENYHATLSYHYRSEGEASEWKNMGGPTGLDFDSEEDANAFRAMMVAQDMRQESVAIPAIIIGEKTYIPGLRFEETDRLLSPSPSSEAMSPLEPVE